MELWVSLRLSGTSHPVPGDRLRKCVSPVLCHRCKMAFDILGTPDDLKFRSCLTFFLATSVADEDKMFFDEALERFPMASLIHIQSR